MTHFVAGPVILPAAFLLPSTAHAKLDHVGAWIVRSAGKDGTSEDLLVLERGQAPQLRYRRALAVPKERIPPRTEHADWEQLGWLVIAS